MPSPERSKLGKSDYNRALNKIRANTDLITAYVSRINIVIMAALDLCDRKKNVPFMTPLIVHLSNVSAKLTEIQTATTEIRSAVERIAKITYYHLKELDNGD